MNPLSWNPWLVLLIAGLFEIGWPLGLKMGAANAAMRYVGPAIAVACMAASGFFLWLSLKQIPIGTAYAVWTGIGSLGAFFVGVYVFGDTASLIRWVGIALVVCWHRLSENGINENIYETPYFINPFCAAGRPHGNLIWLCFKRNDSIRVSW
jgi:quaternary ammonium compound-resistance protein SugE